jgi:hypothetical protein
VIADADEDYFATLHFLRVSHEMAKRYKGITKTFLIISAGEIRRPLVVRISDKAQKDQGCSPTSASRPPSDASRGWRVFFPTLSSDSHIVTYTPVASPHVLGVQGRYFVIALPMAAIFMASLINLELPHGVPALVAITGSMIAGVTSVDAVLKAHW